MVSSWPGAVLSAETCAQTPMGLSHGMAATVPGETGTGMATLHPVHGSWPQALPRAPPGLGEGQMGWRIVGAVFGVAKPRG